MRSVLCRYLVFVFGLACATPAAAQQPTQADVQAIRAEVDRLKQELAALEAKLATLGGAAPAQPAQAEAPPPTAEVPAGAAGAGGPEGALPLYGAATASSKIFNPDMAVIGDFLGAAGRNNVAPLKALDMHESEASLQAIVDPYARADFFISFGERGVDLEEGFMTFPALPGGFLMKVGKMRASFGKVNAQHNHVLSWTDRPLVTSNLVGGEEGISDSGLSVSRLLLNPWFFLEATGEVYRGDSEVFTSHQPGNLTYVGRVRGYRDVSDSSNLDLGASFAYGRNANGPDFATRLIGVDATFRYRPLRRAIYRRFLGRTEVVWNHGEQPGSAPTSFGFYGAGDYQFARRWFAGARYDYSERAFDPALRDKGQSLVLTYWPSEFSQVRGQYRRTDYAEGSTVNEFVFQFLFSIGAHGAHTF